MQTITPPRHFGIVEPGVYRCAYPRTLAQVAYLRSLRPQTFLLLSIEAPPRAVRRALEQPYGPSPFDNNFGSSAEATLAVGLRPAKGAAASSVPCAATEGEEGGSGGQQSSPIFEQCHVINVPNPHSLTVLNTARPLNTPIVIDLGPLAWAEGATYSADVAAQALEYVFDASSQPVVLMDPSGESEVSAVVAAVRTVEAWALSSIIAEATLFTTGAPTARRRLVEFIERMRSASEGSAIEPADYHPTAMAERRRGLSRALLSAVERERSARAAAEAQRAAVLSALRRRRRLRLRQYAEAAQKEREAARQQLRERQQQQQQLAANARSAAALQQQQQQQQLQQQFPTSPSALQSPTTPTTASVTGAQSVAASSQPSTPTALRPPPAGTAPASPSEGPSTPLNPSTTGGGAETTANPPPSMATAGGTSPPPPNAVPNPNPNLANPNGAFVISDEWAAVPDEELEELGACYGITDLGDEEAEEEEDDAARGAAASSFFPITAADGAVGVGGGVAADGESLPIDVDADAAAVLCPPFFASCSSVVQSLLLLAAKANPSVAAAGGGAPPPAAGGVSSATPAACEDHGARAQRLAPELVPTAHAHHSRHSGAATLQQQLLASGAGAVLAFPSHAHASAFAASPSPSAASAAAAASAAMRGGGQQSPRLGGMSPRAQHGGVGGGGGGGTSSHRPLQLLATLPKAVVCPLWWAALIAAREEELFLLQRTAVERVPMASLKGRDDAPLTELVRFDRNPPALGPKSKFSKVSIAEEEDA